MNNCLCILNDKNSFESQADILSLPPACYVREATKAFDCRDCFTVGAAIAELGCDNLPCVADGTSAFLPLTQRAVAYDGVLVFLKLLPCITQETLARLLAVPSSILTDKEHLPLAMYAPLSTVTQLSGCGNKLVDELQSLGPVFTEIQVVADDGVAVTDGVSLYENQEALRRRINFEFMRHGVMIVDPNNTHISPSAIIESGARIMPGCFIYGKSHIEATAKIGPNTMIVDSVIGCGASITSSQVYESHVGSQTTVGPFAYIRPGCDIGEKVKVGDFVELKKAKIGNGTKISHLAYLGDVEIGQRSNIGCGAITVNYDGKNKFKTSIGDDCFVGCNVNLVAPVTINDGAFVSAGATITDEVPCGALAIARARQTNKENWATNRRKNGDL